MNANLLRCGVLLLGLLVIGCVPYQTYEELKRNHEQAVKVNNDLTAKYDMVARELARIRGGDKAGLMTEQALREQLAAKTQLIRQMQDQLDQLEKMPGGAAIRFTEKDAAEVGEGVSYDPVTGSISMEEAVLFNSGEATLKSGATQTLNRLANLLKTKYPGEVFHLIGHTDNVPLDKTFKRWGTNTRLGFERAYMVFDFLRNEHKISESHMVVHSYGDRKPTDPSTASTKEGRARNRRVEIFRGGTKI
ncbi:MAG: OmpA family protein [Planctomycetes bacterium]|nr:OmpA family protein [Planctomycetota bacterium]